MYSKKSSFDKAYSRLLVAFSKNSPIEMRDKLFLELDWIAAEAWEDIADYALEEWDTWPKNFVKSVKMLWYKWLNKKKKRASEDRIKKKCDTCNSTGLIHAFRVERTGTYVYAFRCQDCYNWEGKYGEDYPCISLETLAKNGFVVGEGQNGM